MCAHYLATVNPIAAAEIKPQSPVDRPFVGKRLKYIPRQGEGRGARTDYYVDVTHVYEDGRIDGIVPYDAADYRDIQRIPQRTPEHQYPAWDWLDGERGAPTSDATNERAREAARVAEEASKQVADLEAVITRLQSTIENLREAINTVAQGRDDMQKRLDRLEAPATPRVKRKYTRKIKPSVTGAD